MATLKDILADIKSLSPDDFDKLVVHINSLGSHSPVSLSSLIEKERFNAGRVCPVCGSVHVRRNGKRADGVQKYRCMDCNRHFVATTNSIVSGTRKDLSIWKKYIECMLLDMTLEQTAMICDISVRTAFTWRHKILDALMNMEEAVKLDGIIEMDETFFDISYKGNHTKGEFRLPRRAHKRGKSIMKRGLSREKVCVSCAVNRNGLSYAKTACKGKVSVKAIDGVLGNRVVPGSVICTDGEKSYNPFAKKNNLVLMQLKHDESERTAGKKRKAVVKGIYHIQTVNSYHSRLDGFLDRHRGVSTKYLNNYLVWNNFMNFSKECFQEKKEIMLNFVVSQCMKVRARDISARNPLPLVS